MAAADGGEELLSMAKQDYVASLPDTVMRVIGVGVRVHGGMY